MIIGLAENEVIIGKGSKGGRRRYHTDPMCGHAGNLDNPRIVEESVVRGLKECMLCSGEHTPNNEQTSQTDFLKELGVL